MIYPDLGTAEWKELSPGAKMDALHRYAARLEGMSIAFTDALHDLQLETARYTEQEARDIELQILRVEHQFLAPVGQRPR